MPRITAATVADHRAKQHAALLDAARDILATEGAPALTPAAVGARIGLARSSVYRYFASTADILAQLTEDAFPRWADRLRTAIAPVPTPTPATAPAGSPHEAGSLRDRVRAYGRAALDFVGSPDYAVVPAVQAIGLSPECRNRVEELHGELVAPLAEALDEAGYDHCDLRADLAWGVLRAGARRLMPERPRGRAPMTDTEIIEITLDALDRVLR
ncbi:TetR/AcrR family transcriptional regulator [Sphaerimonospora sp. CA-214678]|uniref:TetR/AcrR family transcriptional regulator n=1 Tax=Sphaerimonospora sp. CA-214678 TaxID=3240029 RepID=UPI003D8AD4FC